MSKKIKKNKNDKSKTKTNVINFIKKSEINNKIQTEQMEIRKMDNLAKELVDTYFKASKKSFIDMGYCAYLLLFRILQRMIFHLSYPVYRHYFQSASKEIINNHKQWLHEFKEWNDAPTEGKIKGEKKDDHENDTLH